MKTLQSTKYNSSRLIEDITFLIYYLSAPDNWDLKAKIYIYYKDIRSYKTEKYTKKSQEINCGFFKLLMKVFCLVFQLFIFVFQPRGGLTTKNSYNVFFLPGP